MARQWTLGQKIAGSLALPVTLSVAIGAVSIYTLRSVVASKDRVISVNGPLLADAERLHFHLEQKSAADRAFFLTRGNEFIDQMRAARGEFAAVIERLKRNVGSDEERRLVDAIERTEAEHQQALDQVVALRRTAISIESVGRAFDEHVLPKREQVSASIGAFVTREEQFLGEARNASSETASFAITFMSILVAVLVVFAILIALALTRSLSRQIGGAVGQVQSSSAELQAAANQQATGAKEQATAMNEITTTISELLASSRQIAESARQVAKIAEQTAAAARAGGGTVHNAHDSIAGIRRQVDLVVDHMLELGKKSQQIGAVLDVVSELAEQTNILAINATIEAAGAGEAGKRFAVVADEIRKLADRVAGYAKEIRTLIDDVRSAVNTTVMATETGSKAVDTGAAQFGAVTSVFKQIAGLVGTTTEAAREIELSTKQQTSAVEQVNAAVANVAKTTKETEASSGQTLQTASQLATLSRELLRLVKPQANGATHGA